MHKFGRKIIKKDMTKDISLGFLEVFLTTAPEPEKKEEETPADDDEE